MPNPKSPRVRAVPAVTRAIAILRLLSRSREPMSLKAIAESSLEAGNLGPEI